MRSKTKKILIISIVVLIIIAAAAIFYADKAALPELSRFNSGSITDWKLGDEISGISCIEDAKSYDPDHYEFFTDENGSGIKSLVSDTRYYLGAFPQSDTDSCRVVGFSTTENFYSVMGVRIGDDELDTKTQLLDAGYHLNGGGYNSCRAIDGAVHIYMNFETGSVVGLAVFLR